MSLLKLLVLSYEYPPVGGGGGIMLKNVLERFDPNQFSITLITTWFENLAEHEVVNEINIHRVKSKRKYEWQSNPIEMLSWIKFAKQKSEELLKTEKYNLVISNFVVPGGILAYYLYKKYQLPYICISHGHDIPWVKPYSLYPLFFITQWKIKKIIKSSKGAITLSPELEKNAINFIGKAHSNLIHQIPNGYNHHLFYPREKVKNEIPKLLFVGRLVTQKGVKTLMKIALELKKHIPFELTIVGEGPKRKFMEAFSKKNNLESQCIFLGKITQIELSEIYSKSDLLIAPSISEGMSLAIIEAVSCNLFVITTEVSGTKEIIKNTKIGYMIKNSNCKYFTKYILDYIHFNHNDNFIVNQTEPSCNKKISSWDIIVNKYTFFLKNLNL